MPTPLTNNAGERAVDKNDYAVTENGYVKRVNDKGEKRFSAGLAEYVKFFPTPRAFSYKDSTHDRGRSNLGEVVGGYLNPDWVEWMMGFPQGWTNIEAHNTSEPTQYEEWPDEKGIPRTTERMETHRKERLITLGNAAVPQQFYPFLSI